MSRQMATERGKYEAEPWRNYPRLDSGFKKGGMWEWKWAGEMA